MCLTLSIAFWRHKTSKEGTLNSLVIHSPSLSKAQHEKQVHPQGMDRSIPNRNRKRNETVKVPSLEDMCFRKVIDNVKHIGNGIDLSHLTNYLWQNFYQKRFGQRSFKSVVEKISSKNVSFRWKDLYEAKLKNVEEAEQKSIERMRQLYQNEDAQKKSRQVKPCTKVPPSSHKRNCYGGWGPGRIVGSSKGSLMKKSRDDFVNSQEVRNLTALRQNAVQKNDSICLPVAWFLASCNPAHHRSYRLHAIVLF
ncbi:hypothetical protein DCAR_0417754 [Daucus carota subsp. sativus]|uniref:Uncharacterized protein n=1 Tax=Daucus carota subsp. sativus TaxID=79200 RepID=A0AAF0WYY1_DAUCS|nr:hypothetical protein DCAR_0417754 [Daucus carota subsp. sativus]